ncbi:hypothetical protein PN499_05455 [Kamptonema animale CS-326]|jgi:hypothetical protein|uniref:hypothetical protein n=1 Tax=Kamptonema animale TaxID=92934 RepID=UPI00232EFE85|nr:hypothetical protein [Kamptonema animale]MDB9510623.1 hypothetical protein [Kamptonema animale CS-326]
MIVLGYLVITLVVFCIWFAKFWGDTTTPKDDRISWIALMIGPLFWPIVLPFSILELASKKSQAQKTVEDDEIPEIMEGDDGTIEHPHPIVTNSPSE